MVVMPDPLSLVRPVSTVPAPFGRCEVPRLDVSKAKFTDRAPPEDCEDRGLDLPLVSRGADPALLLR